MLKISLILVDSLLKVGPGKTKKILEKSLKSHGIFSQKRCMNPVWCLMPLEQYFSYI